MHIRSADLVDSIAAALQYIAVYHPPEFIAHLTEAWRREESPGARDAMAQILTSSWMSATGRRPICQDTGSVEIFLSIGTDVRFEPGADLQALANEGVRRAYRDEANPLRASIVADPIFDRINTRDNTPAVVETELVPGDRLEIIVCAKGGGAENKARFAVLRPSDSLVDWVVDAVAGMGAGWCPPGMLGIGVGGTAQRAMALAKRALFEPLDMHRIIADGPASREEGLRHEIYDRVNALGIGAQGLGGLTAVLDVKLRTFPCHASALPVALIPNCAATRYLRFTLDSSGPVRLTPPAADLWPGELWVAQPELGRRVDLDNLSRAEVAGWRVGETLLLNGRMLTGRDAAHKRMVDMLDRGESLPIDLAERALYYVGPVAAVGDEVVGPAGPTTSTRMDKFTDRILGATGLRVMVGKAERGTVAREAIHRHGAAYLSAVGGAALLVSRSIIGSRVVAFEDLGMEAIHEFTVRDMPVTVAVDTSGASIHESGPALWRKPHD
ncbi:MAG: fumarate hydratase [Bradyrhizobium sp.]|nr:fumarate hydratase [Bradyrhizobium sp.]